MPAGIILISIDGGGRMRQMWAAPFPRQRDPGLCKSGESELSRHACVPSSLFSPDWGCNVDSLLQAPDAFISLPSWTISYN